MLKSSQKECQNLHHKFPTHCQKKEAILTTTESYAPDIIIGTETWLNSSILNNEIFPPGIYKIEHRERPDGYGGVLSAVKKNSNSKKITANINIEQVWIKINHR